jgi:hypothetical protein
MTHTTVVVNKLITHSRITATTEAVVVEAKQLIKRQTTSSVPPDPSTTTIKETTVGLDPNNQSQPHTNYRDRKRWCTHQSPTSTTINVVWSSEDKESSVAEGQCHSSHHRYLYIRSVAVDGHWRCSGLGLALRCPLQAQSAWAKWVLKSDPLSPLLAS